MGDAATNRTLQLLHPGYGPPDEPSIPVGCCPCCEEWFCTRNGRVVGHQLNNGELCRGSGLKPSEVDSS